MVHRFLTLLIALAGIGCCITEAMGQNQSVLVTPRVQLEAQVFEQADSTQASNPPVRQYSGPQAVTPAQYYYEAQMQYYLWFNAHYRPTRGPLRRVFVGPYVRRAPWDQRTWMYHYYMGR